MERGDYALERDDGGGVAEGVHAQSVVGGVGGVAGSIASVFVVVGGGEESM